MTDIWFIRHGQSVSNANLPTRDPVSSELTPQGWAEARRIARAIPRRPDLIASSPYRRAWQTADPTLTRFAPVTRVEWPVEEYTYLAPERYHGKTVADRRPYARAYRERGDPAYKDEDQGESFVELMARVAVTQEHMHRPGADFVLVFSHGLFMRALLWSVLSDQADASPAGFQRYWRFSRAVALPNGVFVKFRVRPLEPILFYGLEIGHLDAGSGDEHLVS